MALETGIQTQIKSYKISEYGNTQYYKAGIKGKWNNPVKLAVPYSIPWSRCPRGVMVKAMNCGIVVREFVIQSRYYVHFRANTLGKGMNLLILPPAMGK